MAEVEVINKLCGGGEPLGRCAPGAAAFVAGARPLAMSTSTSFNFRPAVLASHDQTAHPGAALARR